MTANASSTPYGDVVALATALGFTILCATANAQAPEWHYIHGGNTHGIWLADDVVGATAEDGGRMRFSDDGATWTEAGTPDAVRGMLRGVMFLDTNVGYCVGDDGAVLKTLNSGADWTRINSSNPITSLKTDAFSNPLNEPARLYDLVMFDELEGYAVGDDGVLVYTDSEWSSWSDLGQIAASEDPVDVYDLYMWDADTGVFVGDYGLILRMTTSGGVRSWTLPTLTNYPCVGNPPVHVLDWWSVAFDGNDGWIVGGIGTNNGLAAYSTDAGQTWDQVQYIVPLDAGMMAAMQAGGVSPTLYGVHLGSGVAEAVGYAATTWEFSMTGIGSGIDIFDQCDPENDFDTGTSSPVLICTDAVAPTSTNGSPPHNADFRARFHRQVAIR